MALIEERIQNIKEQEQDVKKNMAARLAYQTNVLIAFNGITEVEDNMGLAVFYIQIDLGN